MKKVFQNSSQVQCTFLDSGVIFGGADQEVYFPYGCLDTIKISLMGILQAACRTRICSFAADRKDRAQVKEMVQFARDARTGAPGGEPLIIDLRDGSGAPLVDRKLPAEEQLKQYKTLFIQGAISKEIYDVKKQLLK